MSDHCTPMTPCTGGVCCRSPVWPSFGWVWSPCLTMVKCQQAESSVVANWNRLSLEICFQICRDLARKASSYVALGKETCRVIGLRTSERMGADILIGLERPRAHPEQKVPGLQANVCVERHVQLRVLCGIAQLGMSFFAGLHGSGCSRLCGLLGLGMFSRVVCFQSQPRAEQSSDSGTS